LAFSVFSLMREAWSTQTVVKQNTEAQRLGYFPDSHLAQISLRKGPGEHVLHCEGSLKGLPYPGFEQKRSTAKYCQLQLPLFFTSCDVNHQCQAMSELCVGPLYYGEQPNDIVRQLNLCYICKSLYYGEHSNEIVRQQNLCYICK
jgi:hypothetical protein